MPLTKDQPSSPDEPLIWIVCTRLDSFSVRDSSDANAFVNILPLTPHLMSARTKLTFKINHLES